MNRFYFELICYKAMAELKAESSRSYLGFFWWILEPALYMVAFYIVFALVFQRGGAGFIPFLLCGLVVWKWFGSVVSGSANVILSSSALIRQVYIPKYLLPVTVLLNSTMKFLIVMCLFILFLLLYGIVPTVAWLSLPMVIIAQFLFIACVAGFTAAVVPLLPDIKLILDNVLMLLFFISGVFFDISLAPDNVKTYLILNPMAVIIESYRVVLINGVWPDFFALSIILFISVLLLAGTYRIFKYYDRVYPKILI